LTKHAEPSNLSTILQATSEGALVDQNGRVVYYGTHLNGRFADFFKKHDLADPERILAADPQLEFPPGALELKSSWKVLGAGDDPARYFTTVAVISELVTDEAGSVVVDPAKTREEKMGLLGLHVVGTIVVHPEFIWATFEHVDNAPDLPEGVGLNDPVDDARDWTLYARSTLLRDCNKNPEARLKLVDAAAQRVEPIVHVYRHFPLGGSTTPGEIKAINASVHRQLPAELAVWKNYSLIGAVWLATPETSFRPDREFNDDAELAGEVKLSNASMETFTQRSRVNCLRCHNTLRKEETIGGKKVELPGKKILISHVVVDAFFRGQEK
jgi:hypothetical protein